MVKKKKQTAAAATVWSFLERISTQVVGFVIGIVLARLLTPYDYGVVGLITIFIALSNVFIDSGFANGLIRKTDRTEKDLSTAFYFNVIVGLLAYGILFLCSPLIAGYFDEPLLVPLVKIAGLNVLLNSLCIVQTALLTANLNIRLQTIINVCAQLPAGIIAIVLAYCGLGVYALALQTVISTGLKVVMLWYFAKWRPKERFDKASFKYLWGFGSRLLGANLIGTFFNQIYSVLIGKYIGKDELGYFSKSSHLNSNVDSVSTGVIQKVALPVLAKYQENVDDLCKKFREIMRLLVMIEAPLSAFFCFSANDIVILLWTEKWIQSAVLFQLLIVGTMFNPIGQLSLSLMQVVGRTGLILKLEFPKKMVYCIYIAIGFMYGVVGLVIAHVFINLTGALINMWATKKILPYGYITQLIDLGKYMVIAYSLAWIVSLATNTGLTILNIGLSFISLFIAYVVVLFAIHDDMIGKYFKRGILK